MECNSRIEECWYKEICSRETCEGCIKFLEMKYLMEHCNLPKSKQQPIVLTAPQIDLEAYKRLAEIKDNILDFVAEGKNLYITSFSAGNGKTSWAIKLMHKYFEEVWDGNGLRPRALFISVPQFLLKCKDFGNKDPQFEEMKKLLHTIDLVVWDDVASTTMSAYDYSQLLAYLDTRILSDLSNIYTGNYETYESVKDRLGMKLASRIFTNTTEVITFNAVDLR